MSSCCPYCGDETRVERAPLSELRSLSLDEFEALVRNEWRRRLARRGGRRVYRRRHPRRFIRALLAYALAPESPVRTRVVDDLLWQEVAEMEAWGFSRRLIQTELLRLSQAIWEVLSRTELDFDRSVTLTQRIDDRIFGTLAWPLER